MLSKEYLGTARILVCVARNMADQAIADRLRALAEGYECKAGKALQIENAPTPLAANERAVRRDSGRLIRRHTIVSNQPSRVHSTLKNERLEFV